MVDGEAHLGPPSTGLRPADAAVGIIVDEEGRYLVQLRDDIPTIFFPGHWGCFGGALEPGETDEQTLARELMEEIGLDLARQAYRFFCRFTFAFARDDGSVGSFYRAFYVVDIPAAMLPDLRLGEGQAMRFFSGAALFREPVTPYDHFALWMHHNRIEV